MIVCKGSKQLWRAEQTFPPKWKSFVLKVFLRKVFHRYNKQKYNMYYFKDTMDKMWQVLPNCTAKSANDLIVYHHWYSFFSQKVLMALYEKKIDFNGVIVDITSNEQYKKEFLNINPRGEVPVIIHKGSVIPDSSRILNYIEKKIVGDGITPLVQVSDDPFINKTILYFRDLIEDLPIGFITIGALIHTDLCGVQKWPFIAPVRNWIKDADKTRADFLKQVAENNPKAKSILLYKSDIQERKHAILQDKKEFIKILERVSSALNEIELQLATRKFDGWLCCEEFSIADVHLAILLERLRSIGLDTEWLKGKRPNIRKYYAKVKKRESFQKSVPSLVNHLKVIAKSSPYEVVYASASVGVILTLLLVFTKLH